MRSVSWGRATLCSFKGENEPVSLGGCCEGGGPFGKRPDFMADEGAWEGGESRSGEGWLMERLPLKSMRTAGERRGIS